MGLSEWWLGQSRAERIRLARGRCRGDAPVVGNHRGIAGRSGENVFLSFQFGQHLPQPPPPRLHSPHMVYSAGSTR